MEQFQQEAVNMELLQFAKMSMLSSLLALIDDVSLLSHVMLHYEAKVLSPVNPADLSVSDDHRRVSMQLSLF